MRAVDDDHKHEQTASASQRTPRFRPAFPILILASLALLVLSRLEHSVITQLRWHVTEAMSPVLTALLVPVEPLRWVKRRAKQHWELTDTLIALREENERLRNWHWRALELKRKVARLEGLAQVVKEADTQFVTARVMANSSGAFVRSVLINAGRDQNVRLGYPVVNAAGVVGRIVDAGETAARVLLLTDLNSRVPVRVGSEGVRAILVGDNGPFPRLDYLPANAKIKPGDPVATSGAGGIFPTGLQVGTVRQDRRGLRVEPAAGLDQLEYLSVLFYNSPRIEMTDRQAPRKDARLVGQKKFKVQDAPKLSTP